VGRTLLSDAFDFDFELPLTTLKFKVKSVGQKHPTHTVNTTYSTPTNPARHLQFQN
jgi:hypothetical protein